MEEKGLTKYGAALLAEMVRQLRSYGVDELYIRHAVFNTVGNLGGNSFQEEELDAILAKEK